MPGRTWYWFCSRSSFAIILIISTVRWVARAEGRDEGKKDQEDAQKCECGWQQCSGYLAKVETSNTSVFSVIQGAFSGKKTKKTKKGPVWTRPEGEVYIANYSWIKKSIVVFGFCPHYLQLCDFSPTARLHRSQNPTSPLDRTRLRSDLTIKTSQHLTEHAWYLGCVRAPDSSLQSKHHTF